MVRTCIFADTQNLDNALEELEAIKWILWIIEYEGMNWIHLTKTETIISQKHHN
jgi:hypothetical protein